MPRIAAVAALVVAFGAAAAPPTERNGWTLEKTAERVMLSRNSEPAEYYAAGRKRLPLVFECEVGTRTLGVRIGSDVKTAPPFTVRFDGEAARTLGMAGKSVWAHNQHQLVVPAADVEAFVQDARTHRRLLLRHDFIGRAHEVNFDLSGLEAAFGPVAEACGVGAPPAQAAPVAGRPASSPGAPRQRQVGAWYVEESVSSLDDKPVVVMVAVDQRQQLEVYLRCREALLEAYFVPRGTVFHADATQHTTLEVALDGGPPTRYSASLSEGFKAAFLPDGHAFVGSLAGRKSIAVTWKRYREAIADTSTIPLTSFEAAATPLLAACPDAAAP